VRERVERNSEFRERNLHKLSFLWEQERERERKRENNEKIAEANAGDMGCMGSVFATFSLSLSLL